jgi:hypothetical protein
MCRFTLVLFVGLCAPCTTQAASWAEGMFSTQQRNLGTVPRGRQLVYLFPLTNNTGLPVSLGAIRASCGCVSARALQTELAPGEASAIRVEMDTRRFQGDKQVVVYVQFRRPASAEVRLGLKANSRDDILVNPASLAFGHVKRGTVPTAAIMITLVGRAGWQIKGVTVSSNYVVAAISRLPSDAETVSYRLTARLHPNIPEGKWTGEVWLETNNPAAPWINVPLEVLITP